MSERREQFRRRVEELVTQFEGEVDPHEWVKKRYLKKMRDDDRPVYEVPVLSLQKGRSGSAPRPDRVRHPGGRGGRRPLPDADVRPPGDVYIEGGRGSSIPTSQPTR